MLRSFPVNFSFLHRLSLGLAGLALAAQAHSAVTHYQFSATSAPYIFPQYSPVEAELGPAPYSLSGSFSYDSSAVDNGTVAPGSVNLTYPGAVIAAQTHFSSPNLVLNLTTSDGNVYAGESSVPVSVPDPTGTSFVTEYWDAVFIGLWEDRNDPASYTVGEYTLEGITLNFFDADIPGLPALPTPLSTDCCITATVYFLDSNNQRTQINLVTSVTAVPLPAAAWLMLTGLIGLTGLKHRSKH